MLEIITAEEDDLNGNLTSQAPLLTQLLLQVLSLIRQALQFLKLSKKVALFMNVDPVFKLRLPMNNLTQD